MLRKLIVSLLIPALAIGFGVQGNAGGFIETIDITGRVPSPIPGQIIAKLVSTKWDVRSIPVRYRVNNTLNPIPNPLGPAFLSVTDASAVLQQSFDAWNNIATSFIQMQIVGSHSNPGLAGFDFVNEVTFRTATGFGAIAVSPSVTLIEDTVLVAGMSLDADADSDVAAGITVATDVDGDGDIEFPAGLYKAGTILDNDVQFNTKANNGARFTIMDSAVDTTTRSVDLMAVAVHEFGHSHGLSHDQLNQIGGSDGTGSTMFPVLDTGDPGDELGQRSLHVVDIAWSSYLYPEGTNTAGPAALQPGDVAFTKEFGLITGKIDHGVLGQPVAGAGVSATNRSTGVIVSSAVSGTTQASFNPATGGLFVIPTNPAFHIIDGKYTMPVPPGNYSVGIEPLDNFPVIPSSINVTAQIGSLLGQQNFNEEFYNLSNEGPLELRSGEAMNVHVNRGEVQAGIDITTSRSININMFGNRSNIGFTNAPQGLYYAVRIPAATVMEANSGEDILINAVAFDTFVVDSSVAPIFKTAMLTTGTLNPDGSARVDLANPLASATGFLGQDNDFAPFHFQNPHELGRRVRRGIERGEIESLFIVLQLPETNPYPGISAQPPLIGLDAVAPISGLSYVSTDGIVFSKITTLDFRFSLVLSEPVEPGNP